MDPIYMHLLINELPLVGVIIGILTLIIGLIIKNTSVKRVALVMFILSGLISIPSYISGKNSLESVSEISGIDSEQVAIHQQAAYEFIRMIFVLSLLALITFIVDLKNNQKTTKVLYIATLACSFLIFFLTQNIGSTGREIRHPEVRLKNDTLN